MTTTLPSSAVLVETLDIALDLNLRAGQPAPSARGYYQDVPRLGHIPEGTQLTVEGAPKAYSRASGLQYWAKVTVDYIPTGKAAPPWVTEV